MVCDHIHYLYCHVKQTDSPPPPSWSPTTTATSYWLYYCYWLYSHIDPDLTSPPGLCDTVTGAEMWSA